MPTLCKAERLRQVSVISDLFNKGKKVKVCSGSFMLKVYILQDFAEPNTALCKGLKVLFSAPKASFKRAVDRNKIKRHLRESFRMYKPDFDAAVSELDRGCSLSFILVRIKKGILKDDMTKGLIDEMVTQAKEGVIKAIKRNIPIAANEKE